MEIHNSSFISNQGSSYVSAVLIISSTLSICSNSRGGGTYSIAVALAAAPRIFAQLRDMESVQEGSTAIAVQM